MKKEIVFLIAVVSICCLGIFANSITHKRGFLTSDSFTYLRQAGFFCEGRGVNSFVTDNLDQAPFTLWPLGYPVEIAVVASALHMDLFLASKILNCFFIAGAALLIYKISPQSFQLSSLYLLSATATYIFTLSLSEASFIFSTLLIMLGLLLFTQRSTWGNLFILSAGLILAFLIRYLGIIWLPFVAGICLILRRTSKNKLTTKLFTGIFISAGVMIGYAIHNYLLTGNAFGARQRTLESMSGLGQKFLQAFIVQFNFIYDFYPKGPASQSVFWVVLLSTLGLIAWCIFWHPTNVSSENIQTKKPPFIATDRLLFFAGVFYLLAMIVLRYLIAFDDPSARLLGPATMLLFLAFSHYISTKRQSRFKIVKNVMTVFALLSILFNLVYQPIRSFQSNKVFYTQILSHVKQRYSEVPGQSIVLCADENLAYLRPDLIVVPARNCSNNSSWSSRALSTGRKVYRDTNNEVMLVPRTARN